MSENKGFYLSETYLSPYVKLRHLVSVLPWRNNIPIIPNLIPTEVGYDDDTMQVTMQDTMQVTMQVRALIMALDGEYSGIEIMKKMNLNNRNHFRLEYLQAALKKDIIEMLIPDKPNSRLQKYRLTAKGKEIKKKLEGLKHEE